MTSHELARKLLEMEDIPIFVQGYEYGLTEVIESNIESVKVIRQANPRATMGGHDNEDYDGLDPNSIPAILLKR